MVVERRGGSGGGDDGGGGRLKVAFCGAREKQCGEGARIINPESVVLEKPMALWTWRGSRSFRPKPKVLREVGQTVCMGLKGLCASHFKKIWKVSHGSREKITPPSCINKQRLQQRFDREILPF